MTPKMESFIVDDLRAHLKKIVDDLRVHLRKSKVDTLHCKKNFCSF